MSEFHDKSPEHAEALMDRGVALSDRGRYAESEPLLREALEAVRGSLTAAECRACGNLGVLYALQERRFEAILLFRHGLAVARRLGHVRLQALHLSNLASEFAGLDLWDHVEDTLAEIDRLAAASPTDEADAVLELVLWPRAWQAIRADDLGGARRLAEAYRAFLADRDDAMARVTALALEVTLCCKEGRAEEALGQVDGLEGELPELDATYVHSLRLECLEALGRHEEAAREARRLLMEYEASAARPGRGDLDIEIAMDVARCLGRTPETAPLARRAYDVAAAVTLSRIAELDALTEAIPELAALADDDRSWIRDLEAHYREEQGVLLEHVAALLRSGRDTETAFLYTGGHDRSLVRLCAWCKRVSTREGHWLPLAHYIPADPEILVTHGICATCLEKTGHA